ncbi:MAG TPA: hypothetical protein DDW78_10705, partial [Treponema sp.]|nr:hypothetical protein [Treponema sp.]
MRGSEKTPGLPFAKRSVQQAVRVFFRWERIFVFMLNPWPEARGTLPREPQFRIIPAMYLVVLKQLFIMLAIAVA